ncbi:MAG: cytochrome ubiquinol oxidase subunit I [Pelovirga sp.]
MNYPVWELTTYGGGFLIALIAIVHVFVAHFAVGGGLFLVAMENKAYQEEDKGLLDYVKKHSKFFLLLTMVFGGMTGVGIWWIISLVSPGATSALIHIFVFGWAAEWVFFLAEIIALFIYFYTFGKMDRQNHMRVGMIYFFCAWMSLFLINGIIGFMLTPGGWSDNQNFWSGFFNPSFWPSLVFRTGLALTMCGVFGFVTGAYIKDAALRQKIMRTCAGWVVLPFILMAAGGWWYLKALPEPQRTMIMEKSPELTAYLSTMFWFMPLLFVAALVMTIRLPNNLQKVFAFGVVAIAFVYFGAFEFVREGGRRPFVLYNYMYSNQIPVSAAPDIMQAGFLKSGRWTNFDSATDENLKDVGHELFKFQCSSCHAIDGPLNDIRPLVKKYDNVFGMDSKLNGLGTMSPYMPPFIGSRSERWALATYLVGEINQQPETEGLYNLDMGNTAVATVELPVEIPAFDKNRDEYVLLAWSPLGMRELSDADKYWHIQRPDSAIHAQLVRRGDSPQRVIDGVEIRYQIDNAPGSSASQLLATDKSGVMAADVDRYLFYADGIPVVPYTDTGEVNPYPLFTVTAIDTESGDVLATTRTTVPVSTEMGCKNCHGGGWKIDAKTGISDATAMDVLAVHDRISGTDLVQRAEHGEILDCDSCHSRTSDDHSTSPSLLNLSAAIHGWHANFLTERDGAQACISCHAARPDGATHFHREHHAAFMDCTHCHGTMEEHALSLLKQEQQAGKAGAEVLMANLRSNVDGVDTINPRQPWSQQPDCLNCHDFFDVGMSMDAFNNWNDPEEELFRNRQDLMGVMMCQACHGSTHALYPADNKYGSTRDNLQPRQYQGNDRPIGNDCTVCHTVAKEFEGHHPNSLRQ